MPFRKDYFSKLFEMFYYFSDTKHSIRHIRIDEIGGMNIVPIHISPAHRIDKWEVDFSHFAQIRKIQKQQKSYSFLRQNV